MTQVRLAGNAGNRAPSASGIRCVRRAAAFLSIALCAALLAACGGGGGSGDGATSTGGTGGTTGGTNGGTGGTGPGAATRVPQWLVFTADKEVDERQELFSVLDDGAIEPIRLSPPDLAVLQSFVSPDGRQVAFTARGDTNADGVIDFNDGQGQLYRAPVDGSRPAVSISGPLPDHTQIREVDWSPNSDALVFRADIDTDDVDEIYLVEAGGTTPVKINGAVGTSVEMGDALWSPDGRYVAQVVRNRTNRFIIDRVGINVFDTTLGAPNSTRLTGATLSGGSTGGGSFTGVFISAGITWAPDSSRLAYMLDDQTNGVRRYFQAFPDGSNQNVTGPLGTDENGSLRFEWSDDSRYLAYEVVRAGVGVTALEVFDTTDDSNRRILEVPGGGTVARIFAWQPGGDDIAFNLIRSPGGPQELVVVSATDDGTVLPPSVSGTLPADTAVTDFQWSPQGDRLVYRLFDTVQRTSDLFTVVPGAGAPVPVSHDSTGTREDITLEWLPSNDRLLYGLGDGFYVAPADQAGAAVEVNGALEHQVSPFDPSRTTELARAAQGSPEPDDQRIGFLAEPLGDPRSALHAADADGTDLVEVSGAVVPGGNVSTFVFGAVAGEVRALFSEDDAPGSVRLAAGATASAIALVSGDDVGIAVDAVDGELDVTPSSYNTLDDGEQAVVVYGYQVSNAAGTTVDQTATVTLRGVNDPPTAADAPVDAPESQATDIDVRPLVNDPEGDPLTLSLGAVAPASGTVVVVDDDTLRYTPTAAGPATDSFTYRVNDGDLDSAEATITVTIIQ